MTTAGLTADHLLVDLDGAADEVARECADVLYGTGAAGDGPADGPADCRRLLRRYPGCLLVTLRDAAGGCAVAVRGGDGLVAGCDGGALSRGEHALFASFLHGWLVARRPLGCLVSLQLPPQERSPGASGASGASGSSGPGRRLRIRSFSRSASRGLREE
jgi:hypothetical protein